MRRDEIIKGIDVPFAEYLVFYAPLTEGDLTDHISGTEASINPNATVQWDAASQMLHLYTANAVSSPSYEKSIWWENLAKLMSFPDGVTLYAEMEEVNGECSGNSYSAIVATPTVKSGPSPYYMCNYRYTYKGGSGNGYIERLSHAKYSAVFGTNGTVDFYKDSVLKGGVTNWSTPVNDGSVSVCQLNSNNYKYGIKIRDVRIYNRQLSVSELAQL